HAPRRPGPHDAEPARPAPSRYRKADIAQSPPGTDDISLVGLIFRKMKVEGNGWHRSNRPFHNIFSTVILRLSGGADRRQAPPVVPRLFFPLCASLLPGRVSLRSRARPPGAGKGRRTGQTTWPVPGHL